MKIDTPQRSLLKSVTWRFISIILLFIISYLITSSLAMATSISVIDMLVKMIVYYAHERFWTNIPWGK